MHNKAVERMGNFPIPILSQASKPMRFLSVASNLVRFLFAVVFMSALITSPWIVESHQPGSAKAHSYEVGDLMEKLDADFGALVKAALITSVQELVNETPYETIEKLADSIAATAKILPTAEEFQGDNSMLNLSRRLEGAAVDLAKAAKNKKIDATAKALFEMHGACVRCHEEARF